MLTNPALTVALRFLVLANFTTPRLVSCSPPPPSISTRTTMGGVLSALGMADEEIPITHQVSGIRHDRQILGIRAYLYFSLALALSLSHLLLSGC